MQGLPDVSQEENSPGSVDGEQEYIVTIQLVGYGKPEQVKEEYKRVLKRVLELEFSTQVKSCRIMPANVVRLD